MTIQAARRDEPEVARLRVCAIIGPTASGKTDIALRVARAIRAEIVAVDSMTVYRGMDIGTAKPTREQRTAVPHHMLDVVAPGETYTVARFQQAARAAVGAIAARRHVPLLVGGSGLYFRAVVDDLKFPPADAAVRARLAAESPARLAARLRDADPDAAERIDDENLRRVVRALEVMELTGAPFSAFRESWDTYDSLYDLTVAGLRIPSSELAPRIYERTRRMFEAGLLDEVRGLLDAGLRSALTASRAIAYPEAVAHLDGEITLEEAMHRVDQASRRYARRQMSWFNRDPRIHWVDAGDPDAAVGVIASMMAKPSGSVRDPDID